MSLVAFDHHRNAPRRRSTVVTGLFESAGAQIGRLAGLWSAQISDPLPGCNIRVSEEQAALYREWIENRRRLEAIIAEMNVVSAAAGELLLHQAGARSRPAKR